ncbi:MAG TPA: hypothetical protein PLV70_09230 [Flavobacteriales bacterium]|nr:hypothetical protein [Flavobacteriales bacterium]HRO39340.1 hypothetical protein [Flavobacteriales bacterium]HRP80777.1 hypothetical protein [Flavobacteriales bacterium]HRQ85280.1 hypothetical protein [Flavobacteriales bacterium]
MRTLLLLIIFSLGHAAAGQVMPRMEFALSLSPSTDGQLFCLFLVKVKEGQVLESRPLTRANFIRQAQGRAFSPANPDAEDLFRKFRVEACTLPPDSAAMGFLTDCSTLDDLWKLRYWEYPQKLDAGQRAAKGWSEKPLSPSPRQMEMLNCYGLQYTTGLIIGAEVFHLLHDMGNSQWVNQYRGGS